MSERDDLIKPPPHSIEAEQSLIGGLLIDNQAFDRVAFLDSKHFYRDDHRRIFEALRDLIERGRPADMVLLAEHLQARGDLEKTGGAAYLAALAQNTPSAFNLQRYAEVVRDKAILRELATRGMDVATRALAGAEDPHALAEEAGAAFLSIKLDSAPSDMVPLGVALVEAVEAADNPVKGLSCGLPVLDRRFGGLLPGDFIVIAGRPSMGKTALAMNIAEHVAAKEVVAVFSLEMTRAKIAGRMLRYHQVQVGRDRAVDHMDSLHLFIDHSAGITLGHMRLRLRRLKRARGGLGMVVIDYLQLLRAKAENRTQEVSEVSRGLKEIAKEFEVPVLAVAQLNRGAEGRSDARPVLSDLRESGQIEQDADIIAFVYRDEYYKPDTEWRGIAEIITRKNRDGAVGTDYLSFASEHTRFRPLDKELPKPSGPAAKGKVSNFEDFKSKAAGE